MKGRPKHPVVEDSGAAAAADAEAVVQIKVWLIGISPMVWRRVLVPAAFTLRELHGVIQVAMGWEGFHLFRFCLRAVRYGSSELSTSSPGVTLAALAVAHLVRPEPTGLLREALSRNVPSGEYVTLAVTDTGTGMAPGVANRVFDPFFTTKPLGQGTGLGLSMVDGFVRQSGGHVRLQSQEQQGTTVKIYLPRHLGAGGGEEQSDVAADPRAATASVVVLVVEDEPAVRKIIVEVLSDLGYTMIEAADGRSGLIILESGTRIDLLVTDVGLPGGMNGRQLADAARQQRPGLKTLFVTGHAESVAGENGRMEQGMQLMTKPFAMDALVARVQGMTTN